MNDSVQEVPFDVRVEHPFLKLLSLGYYDGTTKGIVQSGERFFLYEVVAWNGDVEDDDIRIFLVAETDRLTFDSITEAFAQFGTPKWPQWQPNVALKSFEQWREFESGIESLLPKKPRWQWVIAARTIFVEVLACRRITEAARALVPEGLSFPPGTDYNFWFDFLDQGSSKLRI
ncbi:MAG: hypothetical protein JWO13_1971 [Acidobacteriales bacterium]|nr:hypothetical protein [Terriglobales bacterium]